MLPVNLGAVLLAALANFIIGFMFHGPLFGKLWMRLANIVPTGNEKLKDMIPEMVSNYVVNVVFAYVLAIIYLFASTSPLMGNPGAWTGMVCGFFVWLGFVVTSSSVEVIWMKKSKKLWLFEAVASLVSILAMGAIIGAL
jgi:hypothetical protein